MIHPLLPNQLQKTQETMRMAAEFILRPISRKYDKAEHEPPVEMEQLNKAAAAQKKQTGMTDDSVKSMDLGGRNLWAVISLEQMCWGDVGLFLQDLELVLETQQLWLLVMKSKNLNGEKDGLPWQSLSQQQDLTQKTFLQRQS